MSDSVFNKDYFDTAYRNYRLQNPPPKMAFYRQLVEEALSGARSARLLDIGCAFGAFAASLNPTWRVFAADLSIYALGKAKTTIPRARFFSADAAALPCKPYFDCITAFDCLEHVKDLKSVARAIKTLLPSGGWFIFVVPVYDGPTGPIIRLLDHDRSHLHKKSRMWWITWTKKHFQVSSWRGIYRVLLPWGTYLHCPTTCLRTWTPAIAVIAKNI